MMKHMIISIVAALFFSNSAYSAQEICDCCQRFMSESKIKADSDKLITVPNEVLINTGRYQDMISKFTYLYKNSNHTIDDVGFWGEANFILAQIESGRPNPNRQMVFVEEDPDADPIGHDLWHLKAQFGGNIWSDNAIARYGEPALCSIRIKRSEMPRFWGFFARYMSILIASGKDQEVLQEVRRFKQGDIDIDETPGNFLAIYTEQYLGMGQRDQAITYLGSVIKTHDVDQEPVGYWKQMLSRDVHDDKYLTERSKSSYLKKIKNLGK